MENDAEQPTTDKLNYEELREELYRSNLVDLPEKFRDLPFEAAVAMAGPNPSREKVEHHYARLTELIFNAYTLGFLDAERDHNDN